jgi:hypothetical protein
MVSLRKTLYYKTVKNILFIEEFGVFFYRQIHTNKNNIFDIIDCCSWLTCQLETQFNDYCDKTITYSLIVEIPY